MAGLDPRAVPGDDSPTTPAPTAPPRVSSSPTSPPSLGRAPRRGDVFDRLWRLLCSVRFAILLISLAATGVLAGTLIMQAPWTPSSRRRPSTPGSPAPRPATGRPWHAVFAALDLYRVFSAFWWRALLAVLTLSVVICTINRAPGIMASIRRPAVKVPSRLFEKAPLQAEFRYPGVSPEQVQVQAAKVLAARRSGSSPERKGQPRTLFADRNRFGKAGTFLNHIGIVTVLARRGAGGVLGWRDNAFMVPEGSTRAVGRETGLVVRNEGFTDEYFPSGTAKDYRSDLVVLQDGQEVARKTIRVNDPLDVAGVRFHQAFFGPAAVMRVRDPQGNVIFEDGVALGYQFDGTGIPRNGGFFVLGNRQMAVYVLVPAAQRGPRPGDPRPGTCAWRSSSPARPAPRRWRPSPRGRPGRSWATPSSSSASAVLRSTGGAQSGHEPDLVRRRGCMLLGVLAVFNPPAPGVGADRAGP